MLSRRLPVFAAALAVPLLLLCGCNEDTIEEAIGADVARSVESTYRMMDDPALQGWTDYLGYTLVGVSTRQHIPYTFKVADTSTVNAFAAPWGHVYVMRGLLDFAEDEDEVWAVMGHEIGHVVHRDIIKAVKRTLLWNIGASLISRKSETTAQVLSIGLGLLAYHYSREDEREADDAGVTYIYQAGHDPRAMVSFFNRLMAKYEKHKPSKLEALLSTHPLLSARITRLQRRPELAPTNAQALVQIGRGYVRRGRYLEGLQLLEQAVKLQPTLAEAHLSLAEAALGRGYLSLGRAELEAAAQRLGYLPALQRRLKWAAALQPQQWAPWPAAEEPQVRAALAESAAVRTQLAAAASAASQPQAALAQQLTPLSTQARQLMAQLTSLSQTGANKLTSKLQPLVLAGNTAVMQAADVVADAEGTLDQAAAVGQGAESLAERLARLPQLAPSGGPPGMAGWLRRSYYEALQAPADAAQAANQARQALPSVGKSLASAADAVTYIVKLLAVGENALLMDSLRTATQASQNQTQAAQAGTKEARKMAVRAETRLAVAKINLAAAAATPEELQALEQIVAYFARVPQPQVHALVQQGLGLGEAAACLLASSRLHRPATELARLVLAKNSCVEALESAGGSLAGPHILLKFIARAAEQEQPTGGHDAPRFTS